MNPVTDTRENGLESLIVGWLRNRNGYEEGSNADYNREFAVDEARLFRFLRDTQPDKAGKLGLSGEAGRGKFLNRLRDEISRRGVIDVLRRGVDAYPAGNVVLFYQTPSENNVEARKMFGMNIFSVTRQLKYSGDGSKLALDLAIFVNGLPVITCELKNQLTKQNADDAVRQYRNDRSPNELLFKFKRCMVHFAVDDARILFCTRLDGKRSWFLPFDKGWNDGAGNPPNPDGLKTDYLWKVIFDRRELANIIENYAQVVKKTDADTGKNKDEQIFPRYHQWAAVRSLLADVKAEGIGRRYLIQHSAGSGKSNSIAWLAHQLVGLETDGRPTVDSVIVVTDRVNLDRQICDTVKQFMQLANTVAWAKKSGDLKDALEHRKKIIITTIQKFPFILDDIGSDHRSGKFAIIIDEAHSSQSGRTAAQMNIALSPAAAGEEDDTAEDRILKIIEGRKMLPNASYFAFTATPKSRTLEIFGTPYQEDGKVRRRPFHVYTMKQAIQEGFILDVLANYTPYRSFCRLMKTVEDDPRFDKKRARKRLRGFVEGSADAIEKKAGIIVEHFHEQVVARGKIGGRARAMVVTGGVKCAIDYYYAITRALKERNSPFKAIVAFSGEKEYNGKMLNEASINGFPSEAIETNFKKDPYRFLVVADKFQTGFDEPLLHTMYVDKVLTDVKAVQTLSRLNRACPLKRDTFVLDFADNENAVKEAFGRFYRTTILSGETDPDKLYDLIRTMEAHQVYSRDDVEQLVELYLGNAERDKLDPILDSCAENYKNLDEKSKIEFKSAAKAFIRTYGFLGAILPYGEAEWEKLAIFLRLLVAKLPSPDDPDLSRGILEAVDLDSYRVEAQAAIAIHLNDQDTEIDPVPVGSGGKPSPETDSLSSILREFNETFGNIEWKDSDRVARKVAEIPDLVSRNEKYRNAVNSSNRQNALLESKTALDAVMISLMPDCMELYNQYFSNNDFRAWLSEMVFRQIYRPGEETSRSPTARP